MNINDICKEIRNDLPSFLKSGIEWDDLYTDKESFYERAKSGESPGKLVREYFTVYNTGPYFYKAEDTIRFEIEPMLITAETAGRSML